MASSVSSAAATPSLSSSALPSSSASSSASSQPEVNAPKQFASDLKLWQDQVAKAVQEGSDHLNERVEEICDHQLSSQAHGVGEALVIQLEEAVTSAFKSIKSKIRSSAEDIRDDASEEDVAKVQEKLTNRIRLAGQTIKTKAQSIRDWKKDYDQETNTLVEAAANSTLETIDNIRDLRLQDIGRRWSSNDQITHKSWAKYSELKKASSQHRDQIGSIASTHPKLSAAREAATAIEEKAMTIASGGAAELARLKAVAQWKIDARDSTDDFNTKVIPAGAAKAKQQVLDKISDASAAVVGTSQGTVESVSSVASSKAEILASSVSEAVVGTETGTIESVASSISSKVVGSEQPVFDSVTSVVEQSAKSVASVVSETVVGTSQSSVESVASVAQDSISSAVSAVSETVIGTSQPIAESVVSVAQASADSAASVISDTVIGTQQPTVESIASVASSSAHSIASVASESVIGTEPGFIEQATSKISEVVTVPSSAGAGSISSGASSSVSSVASSVVSAASNAVPDSAMSDASSGISSVVSSVVSSASDAMPDVPSASAKASRSVFGGAMAQAVPDRQVVLDDIVDDNDEDTYSASMLSIINNAMGEAKSLTQAVQDALKAQTSQGTAESVSSIASEQYASAMAAASSVFYGTTPGPGGAMAKFASDKYDEAVAA